MILHEGVDKVVDYNLADLIKWCSFRPITADHPSWLRKAFPARNPDDLILLIEHFNEALKLISKAQNFNEKNLTKSYSVIDANAVFIGLERVSDRELSNLYSTRRMGVHRLDKNFRGTGKHGFYQVLDDFSIPEAYLLQTVVQYFNDEELRLGAFLRYLQFWNKFQQNI